jgi:hypothetical protein
VPAVPGKAYTVTYYVALEPIAYPAPGFSTSLPPNCWPSGLNLEDVTCELSTSVIFP